MRPVPMEKEVVRELPYPVRPKDRGFRAGVKGQAWHSILASEVCIHIGWWVYVHIEWCSRH